MNDIIEVDRRYLWALEVMTCHHLGGYDEDIEKAKRELDKANLRRPIELERANPVGK